MKKIVILQDHLRNGGTERQSVHLARTFAASGHDVTLLTFRPGGKLFPQFENEKSNFKVIALQPVDLHLDFFAPRLIATLRRLAPDIVLCMGRMANCKAARIARALPHAAVLSTMRTGKKLPAAYVRGLHATRHTIANSHEAARILRDTHAVPADKITVIHNATVFPPATGERAFQPADGSAAGSSGTGILPVGLSDAGGSPASPPPLRVLCVAMFRPEKNHRELLEILSKLPREIPWQCDFVGDGPELPACRALAATLHIAGRVRFHGFLDDPAPLYRECDPHNTLAVLTSRSESLPNFLVEAHAHGIPSVACAVGGVAECGGIAITPGDQTAFLAALTRLLTDADFRAAESTRVAAHAREHFSPRAQLQQYLALIEKLTAPTS